MKVRLVYFVGLEVGLALLLLAIWPRLGLDDSYIFLTYARSLVHSGSFALNPGELSYGFSSPAYVMLLAAASLLSRIPVGVALSNILGILMCGSSSAAVWSLWNEITERPSFEEATGAAILLSGPWFFTVWFIFGMETGLATLSLLGFLLWLSKVHACKPSFPWICVGIASGSVLALTRLESGVYIACSILFALCSSRKSRQIRDLLLVAACSGSAEAVWLLFAKHTFGSYLPWTSTARLIYYLPGRFGLFSAAQFYGLGFVGRSIVAAKACEQVFFGGPLKFLLVFVPVFAGGILLYSKSKPIMDSMCKYTAQRWILQITLLSIGCEMLAFVYLFPLVQNRHLAPYIAALWAVVSLPVLRAIKSSGRALQTVAIVAVVFLWIAGALQYRMSGLRLKPLHDLASSTELMPTDRVSAEPIGILSFESKAHILDLGGLTDKSPWPMFLRAQPAKLSNTLAWSIQQGATKIILSGDDCKGRAHRYGGYCVIDAASALPLIEINGQ